MRPGGRKARTRRRPEKLEIGETIFRPKAPSWPILEEFVSFSRYKGVQRCTKVYKGVQRISVGFWRPKTTVMAKSFFFFSGGNGPKLARPSLAIVEKETPWSGSPLSHGFVIPRRNADAERVALFFHFHFSLPFVVFLGKKEEKERKEKGGGKGNKKGGGRKWAVEWKWKNKETNSRTFQLPGWRLGLLSEWLWIIVPGHMAEPWYAVYVAPRSELAVTERLAISEPETFCPVYSLRRRRKLSNGACKLEWSAQPLFSRYTFARSDNFLRLHKTPGVCSIVGVAGSPITIPDAVIAFLRSRSNQPVDLTALPWRAEVGAEVQLSGEATALAGLVGQIACLKRLESHQEVDLWLDMLGARRKVRVHASVIIDRGTAAAGDFALAA